MASHDAEVIQMRTEGMTYAEIAAALGITEKQVNHSVDRERKKNAPPPEGVDLNAEIYNRLKKGCTRDDLRKKYRISNRVLDAALGELMDDGILVDDYGGLLKLCKHVVPEENRYTLNWQGDKIIRFGMVGDMQINSKYTQLTYLHDFYDICHKEGIKKVYNTGDVDEGEEMRQGHKYECYTQGADDHVSEIVRVYPQRDGIETEFITGNHDHSLIKRAGLDIGHTISQKRKDMKYLGQSAAIIELTPNCTLELRHPGDGTAYALSYKTQKMIDAMQGGEKPNLLAIGHYHKVEYLFYRNVHAYQTGCFQAQTPWMKGKQISAHVGGWIVEVHVDNEGTVTRCKGEFFPYYKMLKDDWRDWQ